MSYSATFARTKPAYARAEATSRRGRRQWRRSRTAGVKGVDRPAGGSIQNGLCRSLISQNFLPKGDTNRRFRRTLSNKRFFGASDTTANQRARSSCLRPPHPNARLGILGHARAHRFRARPALPSAPRPPARPPPRARVAGRVSRRLHRDGHARAWLHRRTDGRSRARWTRDRNSRARGCWPAADARSRSRRCGSRRKGGGRWRNDEALDQIDA